VGSTTGIHQVLMPNSAEKSHVSSRGRGKGIMMENVKIFCSY
jgi:hypothetical protein